MIEKKLDREITQDELTILNEHLKKCPQCLKYYQEMEELCHDIFVLNEFFPRIDFNDRVLAALGMNRKVWYQVASVLGFSYLLGLVLLVFTPIGYRCLETVLHSFFGAFKIFSKIKPLTLELFNSLIYFWQIHYPIFVCIFVLSVILFYFFGKMFKEKEALCN